MGGQRYEDPIPDGWHIQANWIEVAGVQHRRSHGQAFAKRRNQRLELEREPKNGHDPNAIRVIGISDGWFLTRRHFLGYVRKEIAAQIVEGGSWGQVVPRLRKIYVGDNGFVEIRLHETGTLRVLV